MTPNVTTLLLKSHLRATKRVQYVGDRLVQRKRVRLKPLFVEFVCKHLDFFRETHGYQLRPGCTQPGQKAHIFILFRDEWLPRALHEMRAEDEGKSIDAVPPTRYLYKRNQNLTTEEPCMRSMHGWEDLHYKTHTRKVEHNAAAALVAIARGVQDHVQDHVQDVQDKIGLGVVKLRRAT